MVLGCEESVENTKKKIRGKQISSEITEGKRLKQFPQPKKILALVAEVFGVREPLLIERDGRNNTAKKTAIYLMKRYSGLNNSEIGKIFSGIHYSAVSKAASRLEAELSEDNHLSEQINKIVSNVKT